MSWTSGSLTCCGRAQGIDLLLSFFFQAEDGIRDTSVTGVQTCALPIFLDNNDAVGSRSTSRQIAGAGDVQIAANMVLGISAHGDFDQPWAGRRNRSCRRSEERRVGKECRSRWSQGRAERKI